MSNSFLQMIFESTLVSQLVLLLLLVMSIGSWSIIFLKYKALRSASRRAKEGTSRFENAKDLREAIHAIGSDPASPLYTITQRGVKEFNSSREAGLSSETIVENVNRTLDQGIVNELTKLNAKMSLLATCSNTAPFIGLFGTVWGILNSFHAIGLMKSASLATVAPGISEALIATAVGLFVAIPASMAYNFFMGMADGVETSLTNFGAVFLNRIQRELGK